MREFLELLREVMGFLKETTKWWLIPVILLLIIIALFIIISSASPVPVFVYPLV